MSKRFSGPCEKSPDGRHKVVSLYREMPTLGCLHCRLRGELVKPTPEQAYMMLVDRGVSGKVASKRTGWIPKRSSGSFTPKTGAQAQESPVPVAV